MSEVKAEPHRGQEIKIRHKNTKAWAAGEQADDP